MEIEMIVFYKYSKLEGWGKNVWVWSCVIDMFKVKKKR